MNENKLPLSNGMKRSDLLLARAHISADTTKKELEQFIGLLHYKIENTYKMLFDLEEVHAKLLAENDPMKELIGFICEKLRKELES